MLKKYNINIVKEIEFPDHYIYLQKEIDEIISISKNLNCKIITTEKDYMRLKNNNEIFYIKSELKIINQENFVNDISKIHEDN
jgi:tetraacyldisaccharide 4'-kinase